MGVLCGCACVYEVKVVMYELMLGIIAVCSVQPAGVVGVIGCWGVLASKAAVAAAFTVCKCRS